MREQLTLGYGLCECGCGQPTRLARWTKTSLGHVKGEPVRFINGHVGRQHGDPYEAQDAGYQTECWMWQRGRNAHGYGVLHRHTLAHVHFWEQAHGPVPDGLELDHLCRNRACVRPDHLEAVTHAENLRRGARSVLTIEQARAIRASTEAAADLASRYGVSRSTVYNIRKHRSWKETP